jgi:hypothetical protein
MALAARSFTEPDGLQNSPLAQIDTPGAGEEIFFSSRRGVFPTRSRIFISYKTHGNNKR